MSTRKIALMRYYRLAIFDPPENNPAIKKAGRHQEERYKRKGHPGFTIGSYVKRDPMNPMRRLVSWQYDDPNPAAPDIEFQITENSLTSFEDATGGTAITIKGIDIETIKQASNFVGRSVRLEAGMGRGFPLNKPEQAGQILFGTILSSVGNWVGTDMSLTLYVQNYAIALDSPAFPQQPGWALDRPRQNHLVFRCRRGEDLKSFTSQALLAAVGNYRMEMSEFRNPIPCPRDVMGTYQKLGELCIAIGRIWKEAIGEEITIIPRAHFIKILPKKRKMTPTKIAFEDLVGQPTWNGAASISFTCPMRANIGVGDLVELPNTFGEITAQGADAIALPKNRSLFAGYFQVLKISHLGQFRSPDGQQWTSTFFCVPA